MFVNGRHVRGDASLAEVETTIDVAEEEAKAEVRNGTPAEKVYVTLAARDFSPFLPEAAKTAPDDPTIYRVPVGDSPTSGPKDALVTIVEFGDYECPYTRRAEAVIGELRARHDDLRFVWKDNPLPMHTRAEPAAELAREVKAELGVDAFWRANSRLLSGGDDLDDSDLRSAAEFGGVDADGAMAAIPMLKHKSAIMADQDLAADLGETATPVFYVNGRRIIGAQPVERFEALVVDAQRRANDEIAKGTAKAAVYDALIKDGKTPGAFDTLAPDAPPKEAPRRGGKKPKIVVQLFSDFQCPACAEMDAAIAEVLHGYGDKVALVYRARPDPTHPNAERAVEAAFEVKAEKGDDAFWRFHRRGRRRRRRRDRASTMRTSVAMRKKPAATRRSSATRSTVASRRTRSRPM